MRFNGGSVVGLAHKKLGKNNQDAFYIAHNEVATTCVVCDGCGDSASPYSEVGARIGSKIIAETICEFAKYKEDNNGMIAFDVVKDHVLRGISAIAAQIEPDYKYVKRVYSDMFLFTVVGAVITNDISVFFSIGDGVIIVNGNKIPLPKYVNNAPPYIAYNLMESALVQFPTGELDFNVRATISTPRLTSFVVGSDGAEDIDLTEFWTNELYMDSSSAITNRLSAINRESQKIDWENYQVNKKIGPLKDDTTIIASIK